MPNRIELTNTLPVTAPVQDVLAKAFAAHQQGQLEQAESMYYDVLQVTPDHPDALHLLGMIGKSRGQLDLAEKLIRRSVAVRPDFAAAHYNLGNVLRDRGQLDEAAAAYRGALARNPDYAEAAYALGNLLRDQEALDGAIDMFTQALAARPDYYEARHNRANALRELGRVEESIADLQQVVAQVPDLPEAHYNLALSLFMCGRYQEGGPHYEWRWKTKGFSSPRRHFSQPQWDGRVQPAATLLVYAEQGLGDSLQFIRYLTVARSRVARLVVEVPASLVRLFTYSFGDIAQFIAQGQTLPPFDYHIAMLSLPWLVGVCGEQALTHKPYLRAEPEKIKQWQGVIQGYPGLRVGINWQGNPQAKIDKGRSLPLRLLAPVAEIKGISLISLQKNAGTEQLADLPPGMRVNTLGPEFDSGPDAFLDAAAVLSQLDLFITTDTALAHLAGAIGCSTLLLLKKVPDWRWGLQGGGAHWYSSMQLFRQDKAGQWGAPIAALISHIISCQNKEN